MDRNLATFDVPLLNRDEPYISEANRGRDDDEIQYYNISDQINKRSHISSKEFQLIYQDTMRFYAEQESFQYRKVQAGEIPAKDYLKLVGDHIIQTFPRQMNPDYYTGLQERKNVEEDFKLMIERIMLAVFRYDVIQPLIDNENTSDIKICSPKDIRVRIKGKAYCSDTTFADEADLNRFIDGLLIRNHINLDGKTMVTFTDKHDPNYILRFTVSSPAICNADHAYMHIRKVSKVKLSFDELIRRGMLSTKVRDYLIDRAKLSRGLIFAGPPGSGKTTALNTYLEYIPKTRETLVIQENDELFTEQPGFMFKHVTHGFGGEPVCTLEELGKMALVEGCNQFIIGEVKGGEMRSAMTLINAGGYAALTIHSTNAYETLDKAADLVKYGSDYSFDEARRMLKTFDTIVYMENYGVREILEVAGYNDETHQFNYIPIYKRGLDEPA